MLWAILEGSMTVHCALALLTPKRRHRIMMGRKIFNFVIRVCLSNTICQSCQQLHSGIHQEQRQHQHDCDTEYHGHKDCEDNLDRLHFLKTLRVKSSVSSSESSDMIDLILSLTSGEIVIGSYSPGQESLKALSMSSSEIFITLGPV